MKVQSMKVKISTQSLTGSTRHLTGVIKIIILSLIIITLYTKSTSALTYQDSVDVSFTFDPTLSISLSSSNISIDSLSPGNYAHSNTVAINVSTNNVYGYTLTAKVGDNGGASGTSASSDLANTSTSTSFTSLGPNDLLALSDFAVNTWGYTTSNGVNNNTTYSGLSYNADTTINMTKNSTGAALGRFLGTNVTNFTIGASAGADQLAGEYTNTITFAAVTNTVPPILYMQDMNLSDCQKNVINDIGENIIAQDRRNGDEYTVRYINGQCWMTQNLRITGIVSAEDSNFTGEDFNVSEYSPSSASSSYAGHCDAGNGYNYACAKYSGDSVKGTWYNYYAATAGTISTNDNSASATYDICPLGWHLPARGEFIQLIGNTVSGYQDSTAGTDAFGAIAGGHYASGSLWDTSSAGWWSASTANSVLRAYLKFRSDDNQFDRTNGASRNTTAFFVRCTLR